MTETGGLFFIYSTLYNRVFFKKIEIKLLYDPVIPCVGIYPKNSITNHKDTCTSIFIAVLFTITRDGASLGIHQ